MNGHSRRGTSRARSQQENVLDKDDGTITGESLADMARNGDLLGMNGHGDTRSMQGSARNGPASQKAPSAYGGSHRAPSNAPSGRHDRIPSGGTDARTNRSGALSPNGHSQAGRANPRLNTLMNSNRGDITPTLSHGFSPTGTGDDDYDESIVERLLRNGRTPRTSIVPSMLEAEVKNSHFHDQDLCILLHTAEDEHQHDVVKKAVRKALQARMKKLKLKYDNEVCDLAQIPGYLVTDVLF